MTGSSGRAARLLIHPPTEVLPPSLGDALVPCWNAARSLLEDVEQDKEPLRASVQNAEKAAPVVTAELSELTLDLTAVWKRQRRIGVRKVIEAIDLCIKRSLNPCR